MEKEKDINKNTADALLSLSLESTQEFFDIWTKMYESSFGKLSEIPTIGPAREKEEKLLKSFPSYVDLYSTWIESNVNFQSVLMEAMRRTYDKISSEPKEKWLTSSPEKYKEFYDTWIEIFGDTFKDFMKSGHYAADMGKLMSSFIDFQKNNKEIIEENVLKPSNIPTKTEFDELTKEIYDLKMTIKGLEKRLKDIESHSQIEKGN